MPDGLLTINAGSIHDRHISSSAGIGTDKMKHIHSVTANFGLEYNATPVAKVFVLYQAQAIGTLRAFYAGLYDSGTSTSVTFDLRKNGVSVLSSAVAVVHGDGDRARIAGTITSASFAAGDVFTVHLAATATTGAQGPYCTAVFEENSVP